MNNRTLGFLVVGLALATTSFAATSDSATLIGKIGNISKDDIQVQTESGSIDVPRVLLPAKFDVRPGRRIQLNISMVDVLAYNIAKRKPAAANPQ